MFFLLFITPWFLFSTYAADPASVLQNPNSTVSEIQEAFDYAKTTEVFDPKIASALIYFIENTKQSDLRARAAEKLYLHFHYKRGQFLKVVSVLLKPEIQLSLERFMVFDADPQVRVFAVRLGQILLGSFDDSPETQEPKNQLVNRYIPTLLLAFRHPDIDLRVEAQAALDNLSETEAFQKSSIAKTTLVQMLEFAKTHFEKDYSDYASVIQGYLDKISTQGQPRPRPK